MLRALLAVMMADSVASLHAAAILRTARAPTAMRQVVMSAAFQDRRSVLSAAGAAAIFSTALPARAVADLKEGGVVGVYSDGFNPDRLRIIRADKGDALVLNLIRGPKGDQTVPGKLVKPDVTFDFPGKPGDKGVVDSKKGTISFADGNVWTKI